MVKMMLLVAVLGVAMPAFFSHAQEGRPAGLRSIWTPEQPIPLPEHPRPHLVRDAWANLNGMWEYAITGSGEAPEGWDGQILVPFCVESALSGVQRALKPEQFLWYRRSVEVSPRAPGERLLLHFGAVDWRADVWVNGREVGSHIGGYDAFALDITEAAGEDEEIEIVVRVQDPTDEGVQPRGKQVLEPNGIWYTAVSGIWQTVWLETVPGTWIDSLEVEASVVTGEVLLRPVLAGEKSMVRVEARVLFNGQSVASAAGEGARPLRLRVDRPRAWSPDSPTLYELEVLLSRADGVRDVVRSYFAFRTIEVKSDDQGVNRLFLNGRPLFHFGPLDQGWWPDGLYTAPTDEALRFDIEQTRAMGFNMCRKHVKVEPQRWYYWADRLGLMVWQDMPSGDRYIGPAEADIERTPESEEIFRREWSEIIEELHPHPCVVVWVPFNEGWGQFKTNEILAWTKSLDPTRVVDGPSGWTDRAGGDMHDMHAYPGPSMFPTSAERASVLGEFGGLGLVVSGHLWQERDNWGYRSYESSEALRQAYEQLVERLRPLVARGLAAAVYTQTTDVEIEVNGLMTYDRKVMKIDPSVLRGINRRVFLPPPETRVIVPTSEERPQSWRFTTSDPGAEWESPGFDDAGWAQAPGGFGTRGTPGAVVGTEWSGGDIWLRRRVQVDDAGGRVFLRMHHDEGAEVFINGARVIQTTGWTVGYTEFGPIDSSVLRRGENLIAVHCRQTSGGQFIDVGIVELIEKGE
ncbi:MAG: hypothetical protein KJZ65_01835 [Phycisphaerales bacterium]|nr:hypothetical protein [Phycisphaerales bacterium]